MSMSTTHPQLVANITGQGAAQKDWQRLRLPHSFLRECEKQASDFLMDPRRLKSCAELYRERGTLSPRRTDQGKQGILDSH